MVRVSVAQESASSWIQDHNRGPEVDVRGINGITLIPTSLVIDQMDRHTTCVLAGRDKRLLF